MRAPTPPRHRRFIQNERGSIAIVFSLSLLPLVVVVGTAVDYYRMNDLHARSQAITDEAALSISSDRTRQANLTDASKARLTEQAKRLGTENVTLTVELVNATDVRVTAHTVLTPVFLQAVPGGPKTLDVTTRATARLRDIRNVTAPPQLAELDPEAGDYNRVYVYCYNKDKRNEPSRGRSQFTPLADNGGTKYPLNMPKCGTGETISFQLHNVRGMRKTPKRWDDPTAEQYDYFSDTVVNDSSVQSYDLDGWSILETVICDSLSECSKTTAQGGKIPAGKNRTPQQSTLGCTPGRFIYMGWEDRPPGRGWTDKDYDDIRVTVSCPEVEISERNVRLVE